MNLEFVSANPTGPVHIGEVRWAAVGDALARILRAQDAGVVTEYYFNDAGAQIDRFADSLLAAARHDPPPGDGYVGGVRQRDRPGGGRGSTRKPSASRRLTPGWSSAPRAWR